MLTAELKVGSEIVFNHREVVRERELLNVLASGSGQFHRGGILVAWGEVDGFEAASVAKLLKLLSVDALSVNLHRVHLQSGSGKGFVGVAITGAFDSHMVAALEHRVSHKVERHLRATHNAHLVFLDGKAARLPQHGGY